MALRTIPTLLLAALLGARASALPGTYEVITPSASGGGDRHIRVTLKADGAAAMSGAFSSRPNRFLSEGTWTRADNLVTVTLDNPPQRVVFQHAGPHQLVTRDWDRRLWGEAGLGVLFKVQ